jgi:hypothetical protein
MYSSGRCSRTMPVDVLWARYSGSKQVIEWGKLESDGDGINGTQFVVALNHSLYSIQSYYADPTN